VAGYTSIADVSETFVSVLRDEIAARDDAIDIDGSEIALASPGDAGADVRLTLYLFGVSANSQLNNTPRQRLDDRTIQEPPLVLDLQYLLTAYPSQGGADDTAQTMEQQTVLGLAMQVLEDNASLDGERLAGSLSTADETLEITMNPQPIDVVTRLWNTFGQTVYQPSVCYEVSPVTIDSTRIESFVPVSERQTQSNLVERPLDEEER
jgi:hypothetical protein